jgi:hypothetical protein
VGAAGSYGVDLPALAEEQDLLALHTDHTPCPVWQVLGREEVNPGLVGFSSHLKLLSFPSV